MKKQLISLILALLFLLSFTACGTDTTTEKETKAAAQTGEQIPGETEEVAETDTDTTVPQITEEAVEEETVPPVHVEVVDTAALDEIEGQDTFAVRITKKEAVKGAFDNGSTVVDLNGEDGYILTVENNTDATVNEIKFLVLAIGNDGKACSLGMLQSMQIDAFQMFEQTLVYNKQVKVMGTTTAELTTDATFKIGVQCSLSNVAYMNVIVLSYVDANGNEIYNNNAATWLSNTLEK